MTTETPTARITVRDAANWRRTDEEITDLARRCITKEIMVVNDSQAIEAAFYMILSFVNITPAASKLIGALIGDYNNTVPGRAMNGYPIFTACEFLHRDDLAKFETEIVRMKVALGDPVDVNPEPGD